MREPVENIVADMEGILDTIPAIVHCKDAANRLVRVNTTFCEAAGKAKEDLEGKCLSELIGNPALSEKYFQDDQAVMTSGEALRNIVEPFMTDPGRWVRTDKMPIRDGSGAIAGVIGFSVEITEERSTRESLFRKEKELVEKSRRLEELSTAMKVFMESIQQEKERVQSEILGNLKELAFPLIQELRKSRLTQPQSRIIDILETNLRQIAAPLATRLSSKWFGLSAAEVRVANFISEGMSNKQIAEMLNVSLSTVLTHRNSIRSKLGLIHKKINLRSHLRSFT